MAVSNKLKSLWVLVRDKRGSLFLLYIVTLASAVLESFGLAALYPLVDVLQKAENQLVYEQVVASWFPFLSGVLGGDQFIVFALVGIGILFFAKNILLILANYGNARVVMGLQCTWMNQIFESYLGRPYQFFVEQRVGDLVQRQVIQIRSVAGAVNNLISLLGGLTSFLAVYTVLLIVQAKVTLVLTILIIPTYFFTMKLARGRLYQAGNRIVELEKQGFTLATEVLSGIRQVKIFLAEKYFSKRLHDTWVEHAEHYVFNRIVIYLPRPVLETLVVLGGVGLVYLLLRFTESGIVVPILAIFAASMFRILPLVSGASAQAMSVAASIPAFESVAHLIQAGPPKYGDFILQPFKKLLELENISFSYNKKDLVLKDVSLKFERNQFYGIVGSSGSGKSTIIDLLTGFYTPQQGRVLVDGTDLKTADIRSWLSQIGVISQETFMFSGTVEDNICFGVDEKDRDLERMRIAAKTAFADEFIQELPEGYKTFLGERGFKLSGGQRQRLAIARTIYFDPPVLIFDEATSALDPITEQKIQSNIDLLHEKRTVIAVAHRLSTVANADHIYVIENGCLVEEGDHQTLHSMNGLYSRLCASQTVG